MPSYIRSMRRENFCIGGSAFGRRISLEVESLESREMMSATQWAILTGTYNLASTFALHSNSAAKQVIYLDFDGHVNGYVNHAKWDYLASPAWDQSGNGPGFTVAELQTIQRIWARVAEDFAPFTVDVTTQFPGNANLQYTGGADDRWGIRVVITPDDTPSPGSGGISLSNTFRDAFLVPCYVFNTTEVPIAEAISHEVGHTLGLDHDGVGSQEYSSGHGFGVTSWGPIMGAAYESNVTQWSKGEYAGATNMQDDLAVIVGNPGVSYRTDDVPNFFATAPELLAQGSSAIPIRYGLIERNTDSDFYSFWADAGAAVISVEVLPLSANLAVELALSNAAGTQIAETNPTGTLGATLAVMIPSAGKYVLRVNGAGRGNPLTNGFSSYGSLGSYRIGGTVPSYNRPPIAVPDSKETVMGLPVVIPVLNNDTDPDGDSFTLVGVSNVVNGSTFVQTTPTGTSVIFTPTAGFLGLATFQYTIVDSRGAMSTTNVTVSVVHPILVTDAVTRENVQTKTGLSISRFPIDSAIVTHYRMSAITSGRLFKFNGTTEILNGSFITATEAAQGLKFLPAINFVGNGSFRVQAATSGGTIGLIGTETTAFIKVKARRDLVVVGAGPGMSPLVKVYDPSSGNLLAEFLAYAASSTNGIEVAQGDVDGDGFTDVITSPGAGGGPHVKVFSGRFNFGHVRDLIVYAPDATAGVFIATGDLNGDGAAEIITGPGRGGSPHVKAFDGRTGNVLQSFLAYGATALGGVRVASGDIDGDGFGEIITAPGAGSPHVRAFDGRTLAIERDFLAYSILFTSGLFVSAGDFNNDGRADIVVSQGAGGTTNVRIFDGRNPTKVLREFLAYSGTVAVRVAVTRADGDGIADVVTGAGGGGGPHLRVRSGANLGLLHDKFVFSSTYTGGIRVG